MNKERLNNVENCFFLHKWFLINSEPGGKLVTTH